MSFEKGTGLWQITKKGVGRLRKEKSDNNELPSSAPVPSAGTGAALTRYRFPSRRNRLLLRGNTVKQYNVTGL